MSSFCSLPWVHLATHPHGGATLCCVSDFTGSINSSRNFTNSQPEYLTLNKHSVTEIMNSDYFKQTRLQMLSGAKPDACLRCYREESVGVRSKRIEENERLNFTEDMARAITSADGTIPVNFKFVELRLGNLCNVKCRTCNPASSTQWAPEYKKLQQELKFVTQYETKINSSWTESNAFWEDLLEHSKDVELLYINGGEPTLVEKHWHYLERLIERGLNKQITLWYNINMTNLPDNLLALWQQFKSVQVSCSIDDLGDRNEYIRTGTKWVDVITNLDKLQSCKWINASICQTVSWMNVFYLDEFHKFMNDRKLPVYMNFVTSPAFLSLEVIPASLSEIIIKNSSNLLSHQRVHLTSKLGVGNLELLAQGIDYNSTLDKYRGTTLLNVFPKTHLLIDQLS